MLFFIVIDKKQGRKKRKQDEFPEKDVLHDNKVLSATKSLSFAKNQERRRQNQQNHQKMTGAWCFHMDLFILRLYLL